MALGSIAADPAHTCLHEVSRIFVLRKGPEAQRLTCARETPWDTIGWLAYLNFSFVPRGTVSGLNLYQAARRQEISWRIMQSAHQQEQI
jgi:hypothetical protein